MFGSLPPTVFSVEGWLAICLAMMLYNLSVGSLGKRSVAHNWLFTNLTMLSPTDSSVGMIANLPGSNRRDRKPPKTLEERLNALQMSQTKVQPGMIALTSMKSTADRQKEYQMLDLLFINITVCIGMLVLRWALAWERVLRDPCCDNRACWQKWLEDRQESIPLLSLMALLTLDGAWKLGRHVSRLPEGLSLKYPPSSYVTAYAILGLTMTVCHSSTIKECMGFRLDPGFDELAARLLLWVRLIGVKLEDPHSSILTLGRLGIALVALAAGWLVFVLPEPLGVSADNVVHHYYVSIRRNPNASRWERMARVYHLIAIMIITALPLVYVTSFFVGFLPSRAILAWVFVILFSSLMKPMLQSYLKQGVSALMNVLKKSNPSAEDIRKPFHSRINNLQTRASQMTVLPAMIVAFLMMTHLCHPTAPSGPLSPLAFEPNLFADNTKYQALISQWNHEFLAHLTHSYKTMEGPELFISLVSSPTRRHMCGTPIEYPKATKKEPLIALPSNGTELWDVAPPVPITIATILGNMQDTLKSDLGGKNSTSDQQPTPATINKRSKRRNTKEEASAAADAPYENPTLYHALLFHPTLSSAVILPVLDVLGLILAMLWMFHLYFVWLIKWKAMKKVATTPLQLAESVKTKRT